MSEQRFQQLKEARVRFQSIKAAIVNLKADLLLLEMKAARGTFDEDEIHRLVGEISKTRNEMLGVQGLLLAASARAPKVRS